MLCWLSQSSLCGLVGTRVTTSTPLHTHRPPLHPSTPHPSAILGPVGWLMCPSLTRFGSHDSKLAQIKPRDFSFYRLRSLWLLQIWLKLGIVSLWWILFRPHALCSLGETKRFNLGIIDSQPPSDLTHAQRAKSVRGSSTCLVSPSSRREQRLIPVRKLRVSRNLLSLLTGNPAHVSITNVAELLDNIAK